GWQEYKTLTALGEADTGTMDRLANVYLLSGKVLRIQSITQSQSRDCALLADYYSRPAGSLSKIESEMSTFIGDIRERRVQWFDGKGKRLRSLVAYFDLESGKPTKKREFMPMGMKAEVFKLATSWPFSRLIKTE